MDLHNCKCCLRCHTLLQLVKYLPNDLVRMIITEYDNNHFYIDNDNKENIVELNHNLSMLDLFKRTPDTINIKFNSYYHRRSDSFAATILFLRSDTIVFTLDMYHCDYEYYQSYSMNDLLNTYINYHGINIQTDSDILNEDGLIQFPSYDY